MRRFRWLATLVVLLALLLGVNAFATNRETKSAHATIGRILHLQGGDLQVREDGPRNAPAIVLLHGFASSLSWWDRVTPALAAAHHVIRFDLLGHGGSAKPRSGYTMEHQAELVDAALAQLGVQRALIVGHSMGGVVATALATRDRARVAGIVLIDSPNNKRAGQLPLLARMGFVPLLGQAERRLATNGMVKQGLQDAFAPGYKVPQQFVTDFWQMTYTSFDASHRDTEAYIQHEPLSKRLSALGVPVLALYGTRDQLVSPASMRDYASIPGAQVVPIKGAGHSPMVEKPFAVEQLILARAKSSN
ncbi:MAG TPA: alpha/beta hydrolase [Solirubrobacteraceae bacterium]|nr:alpha/beta hydrolase [Solirubrobacteraceae bacterium]